MSIGIIGPRTYPSNQPGSSGVDVFVEEIVNHLTTPVTIYTHSWSNKKLVSNNKVQTRNIYTINHKLIDTPLYALFATIHCCFDKSCKTVWFNTTGASLFILLAKFFGKNTILTHHSLEWQRSKWNIFEKYLIFICEKNVTLQADQLTCVSANIQKYLKIKYAKDSKLTPTYLPTYRATISSKILQTYNLKKNNYYLYLGRLTKEKGVDRLISCFLQTTNVKKIKLVIAGAGDYQPKQVSDSIIYTGFVSGVTKATLLKYCKSYVSLAEIEGNPVSIHEACRYAPKVILSDIQEHRVFRFSKKVSFLRKNSKNLNNIYHVKQGRKYIIPPNKTTWEDNASIIENLNKL